MNKTIFEKFGENNNTFLSYKLDDHKSFHNKINKLTTKILKRECDLGSISFLRTISLKDLDLLLLKFSKEYQAELKKIFAPKIKKILYPNYDFEDYRDFRVGIQVKHKWDKSNETFDRKVFYDDKGIMYESESQKNYCFPTRPHQDLANNGYRGSGIMIFYYQASKTHKEQSNMLFSNFKKLPKLLKYSNLYGYGNQLTNEIFKKSVWYLSSKLNYKNLVVMDPYTIHCSSIKSNLPRIAFNIKLQPSNYKFLFKKDFKNFFKKLENCTNTEEKILLLYSEILTKSKKNNRLNFELAVLSKLLGKEKLLNYHFNKILDFKPNKEHILEFLCGAFLKKSPNQINQKQKNKFKNNNFEIVKYSCAYNLLNTIKISLN